MRTIFSLGSGLVGSGFQIATIFLSNILLVPLFLHNWDVKTYGCWITLHAIISISQIIDLGHGQQISRTLNMVNLSDLAKYSEILGSSLLINFIISVSVFIIVLAAYFLDFLKIIIPILLSPDENIANQTQNLLPIFFFLNIFTSINSLLSRALVPFGNYSYYSWSSFVFLFCGCMAQALALKAGFDFFQVGCALSFSNFVILSSQSLICFFKLRKAGVYFLKKNFSIGIQNLLKSLVLTLVALIGNLRQQGIRLIISSLQNLVLLAQFSTIRTLGNLLNQIGISLNLIFFPLFQKSIRLQNSENLCVLYKCLGYIYLALIIPLFFILQALAPEIFSLWTHGKVEFDKFLFFLLLLSALLFCCSEISFFAILSLNPLKIQLKISLICSVFLMASAIYLTKTFSNIGTAAALLCTEILTLLIGIFVSRKLLIQKGIDVSNIKIAKSLLCFLIGILVFSFICLYKDNSMWTPLFIYIFVITFYFIKRVNKIKGYIFKLSKM